VASTRHKVMYRDAGVVDEPGQFSNNWFEDPWAGQVEKSPWDFDSSKLDGFALGRAVGEKQVQVRLLFQNPCVKNPEEFSPQEVTLTLTASPQVLEAVKSAGK